VHEARAERGNVKLRYPVVGVLVGVGVFAAVALAGGSGPKTKLVSRASNGDPAANGYSYPGGITPNGRWVPFESDADNLPGATGDYQVYVRDRKTGSTKLVSKSNGGDPGDGDSYDASISDDGRFIAFESYAANLPASLGPTHLQAYVRDLKNGTTKLVSRLGGGDPATGGSSNDPSISANGRLVAFESDANNLPGNLSPDDQVYLKDRKTGALKLISKTSGGTPANDDSEDPAISPNGRIVGFESESTNLPGGLGGGDDEIYVRDLKGGRTLLVSKSNAGDPANDDTDDVALSANGRFVGFESYATNLPGSIGPTYQQAYLRDRKRNKTTLVSRTNGGDPAAGGYSDNASVSADGKFVQFESDATSFPGAGAQEQVLIRDIDAARTRLVSRSNSGNPGEDDGSFMKADSRLISRDPRFSTFNSYASNLPGVTPPYSQAEIRGPNP
jgi:Tol biopolymer transport system component